MLLLTADVSHFPGHLNQVADALSRFQLDATSQTQFDVKALMNQSGIHVTQPSAKWPQTNRAR